jgi:hypothetical protein
MVVVTKADFPLWVRARLELVEGKEVEISLVIARGYEDGRQGQLRKRVGMFSRRIDAERIIAVCRSHYSWTYEDS